MTRNNIFKKVFYILKPFLSRRLQIWLRGISVARKRRLNNNIWPILPGSEKEPNGWSGWPRGKRFAVVLTHDVEGEKGYKQCRPLMEVEKNIGFRSSFNFVPEKYEVSSELRHFLIHHGFEVGVHGLKHDGKLYQSKKTFLERSKKINYYLKNWQAVGFRSPAMHHNLEWLHDLTISYDLSTFDTDPFEPQPDGVGTIFPFYVHGNNHQQGYIEMPYTLPQDFTLFILMKEPGIHIWKKKLDWIADNGGMVLVNTHPDYIYFDQENATIDQFPIEYYKELLQYIKTRYEGEYWHDLPKNVAQYCLGCLKEK